MNAVNSQLSTSLVKNSENVNRITSLDINHFIRYIKGKVEKDTLKERCKTCSNRWETVSLTQRELMQKIGEGYTVRPAIKTTLNNDSIVSSEWLFLDFDDSTVKETLEIPWSDSAAFWYFSPSYKPGENEKHRLVFRLSRACDSSEYERLYKAFRAFYPKSDVISHGSIYFGACSPDEVHLLSESETLDIEPFIKTTVQLNSEPNLKGIETEYKDGVKTRVLKWLNGIWNDSCSNDIDKLYCLDKHLFQDQPKGNNLAKWGGHRPEDTSKKTGTGFFVYWDSPEFPPRFQNQGNDLEGTFLDYWQIYSGKNYETIDWESENYLENLQDICDDIASHFGVKTISLPKIKKELDKVKEEKLEEKKEQSTSILKDVISKYVFEVRDTATDLFIYYDLDSKVWRSRTELTPVYRHCIKPALIEAGMPLQDVENLKFINYVTQSLYKGSIDFRPINKLKFDDMRDLSRLALGDGDFDIYKKEFTPGYNPEIYNQRRYDYIFQDMEEENDNVKVFLEWLEWTYKDVETRQAIIDWLALNVMGLAYQTEVMFCLWGTPGTGKSIILNLINWMMKENVAVGDAEKIAGESVFKFQNLDGAMSLTIDEFRINQRGWDSLKKFTGSSESVIQIEKKNFPSFNSKARIGITTASQDKFILPNSDDGGIRRRIVPIQHGDSLKSEKWANIARFLANPEVYTAIFFWLLKTIDPSEAVERVRNYQKSETVKNNLLAQMTEQDDVLGFIKDVLEFTNNPEDVVSNFELQSAFKLYLESERLAHLTDREQSKITKISQYVREKARIPDNKIDWKLCPEPGKQSKISQNGKQVKGLRGIKIKSLDSDLPI